MHSNTTQNGTDMTTPNVHEISSTRRRSEMSTPELRAHLFGPRELRHRYDALTPVDMAAYRSRCAEIRALDERADRAREV